MINEENLNNPQNILEQGWFSAISKPTRYIGNEINSVIKNPADVEVSIALAFPDIYDVGMSHLGFKILYNILNNLSWIAAERAFCPWIDLESELRARSIPLTSIETKRPLSNFDIIGFSLQHELSYTNLLTMLDLSGIPFLSKDRDKGFPLIIAGGPACFNPEPVAPIFDAMVIGDGEETLPEISRIVREMKSGLNRDEHINKKTLLKKLSEIQGVYIPSFFKVLYSPQGVIENVEPITEGYNNVTKAILPDIDLCSFPTKQVIPFTEIVHDRLAIEISRGCTRGCRFCQAGMIYRPVRERRPETIIDYADKALRATGFEELSLLSLSTGDYCCIAPLLETLMDIHSDDKVAVSFPSLRVDSLDSSWLKQIKRVRKTGFTLAPEAGNDDLRNKINKNLSNEEILKVAKDVYSAGWNLLKLYFMIGLPGETEEDIKDIVSLSKKVAGLAGPSGKRAKLHVSVATFVPKSHTPFLWMPQLDIDEARDRLMFIRNAFRNTPVRVKWNKPEISWLEGIFARGDRRLCKALISAWQMGARFDAWSEQFNLERWKDAFKKSVLDEEFYLSRQKDMDEILPWDHISAGINKSYLKKEWKKALAGQVTSDCREKCHECGVCDHERIDLVIHKGTDLITGEKKNKRSAEVSLIKTFRLRFTKKGPAKFISHLELMRLLIRAFKRMNLNMVFSEGFHPMPKISFLSALSVGIESLDESLTIQLYDGLPSSLTLEDMNLHLPEGVMITAIEPLVNGTKQQKILETHYEIFGVPVKNQLIDNFLGSDYFPIKKKTKKGEKIINARSLVKSIEALLDNQLSLVLLQTNGPSLKPKDIISEIFSLKRMEAEEVKVVKTKQITNN